ncbi:triosephosphate isomerase [Agromyces rhizosphaerae]|uniref:Triosephosphate isomerase n=1 Tax=Agromyces rhizosphaerae TaxID=88374 RepID=A0A9W6FRD3_9MICO|nr:triose-phosphate isomerase family protein [Agromyces rhizosphaerae]GLI27003.1 triosephosphate isomerase [Agromyces rhizosphaerae]
MPAPVSIGISLKMYFGHADGLHWLREVAARVPAHPAVADGRVECFVIPSYLQVPAAVAAVAGSPVRVGAQDLATEDRGAFTGEVSGAELAEVGATHVEVGHAERRRLFGETEEVVAAKTRAALRNGLVPVLCVGEGERMPPADAVAEVVGQVHRALDSAPAGRVVVAYEPVWAIGAPEPAPADHITDVALGLRAAVAELEGRDGSGVIYGGSAGPGLLTALDGAVDGLFVGRFGHDPDAFLAVLDEAAALADRRFRESSRSAAIGGPIPTLHDDSTGSDAGEGGR